MKIKLTVVFRFWQKLACIKLIGSNSAQVVTVEGRQSGQAEHLENVLFYDTIFYDYKSTSSYFHMSFCTKRRKPLQLNISLPNHVLHKKRCSTDKYCFGKQPCRAQHSSAVLRAGGIHTRSQGSGLTQE